MTRRTILWPAVALFTASVIGSAGWKLWCAVAPASYAQVQCVTDFSDDRKLAGFADDIFFGRVDRRLGQVDGPVPRTQFRVTVLETLKGSLSGPIVVSQEGGTDRLCIKFRMADDPHLIESGKTYLLFTKRWDSRGWHSVLSGYGKYEVAESGDADRFRERFTGAIRNEIPFVLPGSQ